jgi:hypothetical protein
MTPSEPFVSATVPRTRAAALAGNMHVQVGGPGVRRNRRPARTARRTGRMTCAEPHLAALFHRLYPQASAPQSEGSLTILMIYFQVKVAHEPRNLNWGRRMANRTAERLVPASYGSEGTGRAAAAGSRRRAQLVRAPHMLACLQGRPGTGRQSGAPDAGLAHHYSRPCELLWQGEDCSRLRANHCVPCLERS